MNASLAQSDVSALRIAEDAGIEQWLEALGASECTNEDFLREVLQREADDPDVIWEALALLDRHFRRQLIQPETFSALKSMLEEHSPGLGLPRRVTDAATEAPLIAARPLSPGMQSAHGPPLQRTAPIEACFHQQLRVGDVLCGRYRIVELLRQDAAGTFVEAIDEPKVTMPGIRQRLAIHVMDEANSRRPELMQRIGRLQALSHPAIPRIFDVEEDRGSLLLTMELLKGVTLRELLDGGGTRPATACVIAILRSVASALAYAHAQGVAHGDVGISNVLVTDLGDVRLRGFGMLGGAGAGAGVGDPAADRQAFAWLMYDLLAGGGGTGGDARARSKHLRKPAGITRGQWRGLRNALKGEDDACAMLLATFAGNSGPTSGRRSTLGAFERLGRPAWFREWLATGAALLILIAAGFFYLALRSQPTQQVANAATPAGPLEREAVLPPAQPTQPDGAASPAADSSATRTAPANVTAVAMPRIDLPSDAAWVETTQPVARVWVRRRGSLDQAVTFQWWTESGSALPERDFRAVPPRIEMIRAGTSGVEVLVPLIPDAMRGEARTFFVKIDAPGPGATLGSRTLMQVAIVPPGYPAALDRRSPGKLSASVP